MNTEKPTPPEGYEVMLGKDLPLPVPLGSRRWRDNHEWTRPVTEANYVEISANYLESWYAVPAPTSNKCPRCGENTVYRCDTGLRCSLGSCLWPETHEVPPSTDPKKKSSEGKPQLQLIPPALEIETAKALLRGSVKHGPWNWRENKVEIMTYLGAMKRHIGLLLEGEDIDPDTGAHHLGCVAAGCGIVLDAAKHGTLVDNRPPKTQTA